MPSPWTDDHIANLRVWAAELSSSEIAKKLGGDFTRNSVVGKAMRLGISLKKQWAIGNGRGPNWSPARAARCKEQRAAKRLQARWTPRQTTEPPASYVPPPIPADAPTPRNLSILDLATGDCRWPVNEPGNGGAHLFCGHAALDGLPYCAPHAQAAYQPARSSR